MSQYAWDPQLLQRVLAAGRLFGMVEDVQDRRAVRAREEKDRVREEASRKASGELNVRTALDEGLFQTVDPEGNLVSDGAALNQFRNLDPREQELQLRSMRQTSKQRALEEQRQQTDAYNRNVVAAFAQRLRDMGLTQQADMVEQEMAQFGPAGIKSAQGIGILPSPADMQPDNEMDRLAGELSGAMEHEQLQIDNLQKAIEAAMDADPLATGASPQVMALQAQLSAAMNRLMRYSAQRQQVRFNPGTVPPSADFADLNRMRAAASTAAPAGVQRMPETRPEPGTVAPTAAEGAIRELVPPERPVTGADPTQVSRAGPAPIEVDDRMLNQAVAMNPRKPGESDEAYAGRIRALLSRQGAPR